ncbi:hypothetical protein PGT21_037196 [Puccinia graminis f. sp. tritici]|uniref:Uncharacterized protein n=1 Tax=Puccinia graminis f. sp. tritici TaxID=56615 RepID=A0A5B0R404_PUCGR|nr:hypothetical protein PGT21_037196 [Puccinia graminis f. sp. tritici]
MVALSLTLTPTMLISTLFPNAHLADFLLPPQTLYCAVLPTGYIENICQDCEAVSHQTQTKEVGLMTLYARNPSHPSHLLPFRRTTWEAAPWA